MAPISSILLRGGVVLQHGSNDAVTAIQADILVEGNTITRISPNISASETTKVIDCKDKIISPGFIDTHRHLWQTQLKGRHADELLLEYMLTGNSIHSLYSPEDVTLGQLGGCLESIDAGTTTVVDHCTMARSRQHIEAALAGIEASGLRAVFCPSLAVYIKKWKPKIEMDPVLLPEWFLPTWDGIAGRLGQSKGRVRLGLAFDAWGLPSEKIKAVFEHVRGHRYPAQLVTSHQSPFGDPIKLYQQHGILGSDLLVSHANELDTEAVKIISSGVVHTSATPSTELQMGLGSPTALREEIMPHASLGIDCHSATNASIVEEARLLLQWARAVRANEFISKGNWHYSGVGYSVEQAFNLATIQGARAMRLEHELGSIAVGKRADLVVWDGTSPAMAVAAKHAPLAAVLLHSSTRDVDTVLVDGIVRKENGSLLPVEQNGGKKSWSVIAEELSTSYEKLQAEIDRIGVQNKGKELAEAFRPAT